MYRLRKAMVRHCSLPSITSSPRHLPFNSSTPHASMPFSCVLPCFVFSQIVWQVRLLSSSVLLQERLPALRHARSLSSFRAPIRT
ncbi:hypothetical protein BD309DRAFT_972545 [Dichomitus squalens]|nr:hypothetical protein BD309DRAFT_972545 [Dichomitus squalens]